MSDDRFARNEYDDFDQCGPAGDGCCVNEAGRLIEKLRAALLAMVSHSWWDGYDDQGREITVCSCEGSPPCQVRIAAQAALGVK